MNETSPLPPPPACVKCGMCMAACPVYQVTGREGHAARGKQHLAAVLARGERTTAFEEIFSRCLLCGACREACPHELDTPALVASIRSDFPRFSRTAYLKYIGLRVLEHPKILKKMASIGRVASRLAAGKLPPESGMRLRLAGLDQEVLPPGGPGFIESLAVGASPVSSDGISYFVGCLANHLMPDIGRATATLTMAASGQPPLVPATQACCGLAALAAGDPASARELARRNITAFGQSAGPILTSCASCYAHLAALPELFAGEPEWQARAARFAARLREFSSFFLEHLPVGSLVGTADSRTHRVLYHDPCHLRFRHRILQQPRELLRRQQPGIELLELRSGPQCCGQGGLFAVAHPELSRQLRNRLLDDLGGATPELVLSSCSGCLLQWRQGLVQLGLPATAVHLAVYLAEILAARGRPG